MMLKCVGSESTASHRSNVFFFPFVLVFRYEHPHLLHTGVELGMDGLERVNVVAVAVQHFGQLRPQGDDAVRRQVEQNGRFPVDDEVRISANDVHGYADFEVSIK